MKTHLLTSLLPFLLLLTGCSKNEIQEGPDSIISEFSLEFDNQTVSVTERHPAPFASNTYAKARPNEQREYAWVQLLNGLGSSPEFGEPLINSLFVCIRENNQSFHVIDTHFRNWLLPGERSFLKDGENETGIGILWFDEQGEMWASGKNIGEVSLLGNSPIPEEVFAQEADFQAGSKFEIRRSKRIDPMPGFDFSQVVEMEFNARLYNEQGESMTLKAGSFKTAFHMVRE